MDPGTLDLARAHITELRRQACSLRAGCVQRVRNARRHRDVADRPAFHFLTFEGSLFRHP